MRTGEEFRGEFLGLICANDSLLVLRTAGLSGGMPGQGADPETIRVALAEVEQVQVPAETFRYLGLVIGMTADVLVVIPALLLGGGGSSVFGY